MDSVPFLLLYAFEKSRRHHRKKAAVVACDGGREHAVVVCDEPSVLLGCLGSFRGGRLVYTRERAGTLLEAPRRYGDERVVAMIDADPAATSCLHASDVERRERRFDFVKPSWWRVAVDALCRCDRWRPDPDSPLPRRCRYGDGEEAALAAAYRDARFRDNSYARRGFMDRGKRPAFS